MLFGMATPHAHSNEGAIPNRKATPLQSAKSSYNEVFDILEDQGLTALTEKQKNDLLLYKNGNIPQYPVSFFSLGGFLANKLNFVSKRTLADKSDYYTEGFDKLVHANGICMTGEWEITEANDYTGYFKQGSKGLVIARASVALQETTKKGDRGFGLAFKLFPTLDPNESVPTANIFTVDILSGARTDRFLETQLTNNPPLIPSLSAAGLLAKIGPAFSSADSSPTYRPVSSIGRIGEFANDSSPIFIRLSADQEGLIKNDEPDFRREIQKAFDQNPQGITMNIDISNTPLDRAASSGWQHIGRIQFKKQQLTYSCDHRLHFSHPQDDHRNDQFKK